MHFLYVGNFILREKGRKLKNEGKNEKEKEENGERK